MSEIPHANITRLKVKNYRSLADIDMALHPLTVFVGKNSTGKSNVIDVLRFVRDGLTDGLQCVLNSRGGYQALHCWFVDQNDPISIHLSFEGPEWSGEYGFAFGREGDQVKITTEQLNIWADERAEEVFFKVVDGQLVSVSPHLPTPNGHHRKKSAFYLATFAKSSPQLKAVYDFLAHMSFSRRAERKQYGLLPNGLGTAQKRYHSFPLLENGHNLASTLRELQKRSKDHLITQALEVVVEGVDGYLIEPMGEHLVTKLHYTFQNGTSLASNLSDEGDGTRQLLAILAALYQDRFPSPLAIEEPEQKVYSRALALLGDVLQEAAFSYQVLVTTHSPDLIDHFPVDSFLVVEKENGLTKIGPIMAQQRHSIQKKWFSTGEIVQMEGLQREASPVGEEV